MSISGVVKRLQTKVRILNQKIAAKDVEITRLNHKDCERLARIADLLSEIDRLKVE